VGPIVALEPVNAALAAAKILGLSDPDLRLRVSSYQADAANRVLEADRELPSGVGP
jgi:phosphoribosylcarboxyaminoimidazole (NCAIR) mutase